MRNWVMQCFAAICCCALVIAHNHRPIVHAPGVAVAADLRREAFVVPFIAGTVPAWSDACFNPIQWDTPPRCDGDQGWQVVCSAATDMEGWIYGTAFDHLRDDRPGGRASKRANDRVRSRLWRRMQQQQQVGPQRTITVRQVGRASCNQSYIHYCSCSALQLQCGSG